MRTISVTVIKPEDRTADWAEEEINAHDRLAGIREIIKCQTAEYVTAPNGIVFLVDEDANFKGSAPNPMATELAMQAGRPLPYPLTGTVVITGIDAKHNLVSLTAEQRASLRE